MSEPENTFQRLPQYQGLFYDPCHKSRCKKHPCPDCHFCQECSPSRCNICRENREEPEGKLSLQEQIALYERTNSEE